MDQRTSSSLISPSLSGEGWNWHLTATACVARLPWRHRASPSATLDKKSRIQLSGDYIRTNETSAMKAQGLWLRPPLRGALPFHHLRIERRSLAEIDEISRCRVPFGQLFQIGQLASHLRNIDAREEIRRRFVRPPGPRVPLNESFDGFRHSTSRNLCRQPCEAGLGRR